MRTIIIVYRSACRSGIPHFRSHLNPDRSIMHFTSALALASLAALQVSGTPVELVERATPTLYLAGDSTMAKDGANDGDTDGWGQYIGNYLTIPVVNKAIGGRSARSYTDEGRFTEIAGLVQSGDIVVIEFGHNDGGTPVSSTDNLRSDCPGAGSETCISGVTGATVYTFVHYVEAAAKTLIAKGAQVILSSQTPNNLWETGTFVATAPRFVGYQKTAAEEVGTGATFVDHFQAVANAYLKRGSVKTNALYPNDHTHTSPTGAILVAQSFAQAINVALNGTTPLKSYLTASPPVVW
ncbi:carbohydrate esterase family 12 protein [Pseudomassariella vexata]|uniref:Carbohydrate esterase family 12 protein n=1 Tax=Pseudomassariella vexata TaxID=1141098 RepID=A0A1Y2EIE3_9PEZI|nr:carbohydrate esterase family 12 protein [Pseudomassariella vexata]ORY70996.1 carbohydrate esterase family 12 protein [Pseudomassariella vexata]